MQQYLRRLTCWRSLRFQHPPQTKALIEKEGRKAVSVAGDLRSPDHCRSERWKVATRQSIGRTQLELVPELARFAPPARVIDKPTYSAFFRSSLATLLQENGITTVVVSGAETDVCVLSTVLDAVNIGLRVVLVDDALCSSSDQGHDALMTMYRMRFHEQIDLIKAAELPEVWRHQ